MLITLSVSFDAYKVFYTQLHIQEDFFFVANPSFHISLKSMESLPMLSPKNVPIVPFFVGSILFGMPCFGNLEPSAGPQ